MKFVRYLVSTLSVVVLLAAAGGAWFWLQLRGSRPQLDGDRPLAGLAAPVRIERDALGVPTLAGANRVDLARALGFVHAQDRFFQMDLLRRSAAGELAELFGRLALPHDRRVRVHGFRRVAEQSVARLGPAQRDLLDAYTAGVNTGLGTLAKKPWEYFLLRTTPVAWRAEDSILVAHAMWLELQDSTGQYESTIQAIQQTLGPAGADFFAPMGGSWDSALDGSRLPAPPLPPLSLPRPRTTAALGTAPGTDFFPGSNNFALAGAHTASGAALVENDMHLALRVPNTWYRAVFTWPAAAGGSHRVVGVTLPGTPTMVAGSNGHIAWGFTNSYLDSSDIIMVETESDEQFLYRTINGWEKIVRRNELIAVKGDPAETLEVLSTEWGPLIGARKDGRAPGLRWTAHDPAATDLTLGEMEEATDIDAAIAIAHRAGMPNQNLLVGDRGGRIAWTVTGRIPRRVGFDGRTPVSWSYGDRYWSGYLPADAVPVIRDPADGILWSANQRLVGGEALARLGDGGYARGARGGQIRDGLRALVASGKKAEPADLLAIALDDRALFLERWQQLLLTTLDETAVKDRRDRAAVREAASRWTGRAEPGSAAHRIVRLFRRKVAVRAFAPLYSRAQASYERFNWGQLRHEDSLWRMIQEQPAGLLGASYENWHGLLLASVDDVLADIDKQGVTPARFDWGHRNVLSMRHPLSAALPGPLAQLFDMSADPLPGDHDMPRVQDPENGASERFVVSPGREEEGIFHMPGGQSGHPLSPYYRAGHAAWVQGAPTPLLPGPPQHVLTLTPP